MKHADKVIELMSAYPGREFRMIEITRYICPAPKDTKERSAVREAARIVVNALISSGSVMRRKHVTRGGYAMYQWRE
jgi:hypothetical protein